MGPFRFGLYETTILLNPGDEYSSVYMDVAIKSMISSRRQELTSIVIDVDLRNSQQSLKKQDL